MFYLINLKKSLKNICEVKLQALCYKPATLSQNELHHRKKGCFQSLFKCTLRILKGKKHPKIECWRLQKIQIWTFVSLVHQINTQEVLTLKEIFQKIKAVTGKTLIFMIGPFCSHHSICLNIGS